MRQLDMVYPRIPQRLGVGLLTALIHVAFLLLLLQPGGSHLGLPETRLTELLLLEAPADEPTVTRPETAPPTVASEAAPMATLSEPRVTRLPEEPAPEVAEPPTTVALASAVLTVTESEPLPERPVTQSMPAEQRAALSRQLTRLAAAALQTPRLLVTFEQDGKQYQATLTRRPALDGSALEQVTAEVTTTDRGRQLTASFGLKRLAFSQFSQVVDHWDPNVQLHDDEITGRFHSNSRFRLVYDSFKAPKFLGKVTTSASRFETDNFGRRRDKEIFAGGIETRSEPILLPKNLQPSALTALDTDARIHRFTDDTRLRFYPDGTYTWRTRGVSTTGYAKDASKQPIYFIADGDAALFVQGVVAGKMLVYSPRRIVIEGNLTYAHDPRGNLDAPDYLGLVSGQDVEIAPASVTGVGDLEIQAALFAGRRFEVTDLNRRSATLRIYGSVAAGSLSASEPRYATKIEYDARFERQRPPGFPSTNRFEMDASEVEWMETSGESTP